VNETDTSRTNERIALVTLALVALAAALPLWGPGLVNTRGGGDSPFLLQRVDQLVVSLRAGVFPVRWMPDAAYGLGYPFFNYYSALPYYFAAGLVIVGLDVLSAIKFVQTLGFVIAALAMYGWMRRTGRRVWAAWLAGAAYTAAPFHLVNVYVRGDSLSEFYAFAFYPLILWGLKCALDAEPEVPIKTPWRSVVWLWPALAYAGLISSHNISALIFSPFAALYVLALALHRRDRFLHSIALGGLSLGAGILLAAWTSLPALAERGAVQTHLLTGGFFNYALHFRKLDLIQWRLLFDYGITSDGANPFSMGLIQAIAATASAVVLVVRAVRKRDMLQSLFVLSGLFLSTLMITPLSRPLWEVAPLLPMIQFPWRFLSIQSLFTAAATAVLVPEGHWGRWCGAAIGGLLLAATLGTPQPERLPIASSEVTTERLSIYELFTQNIGTTIRYEWLPNAAVPRPFTSDILVDREGSPDVISMAGQDTSAHRIDRAPTRQSWEVSGAGGELAFPVLYWPGWRGYVDGQETGVGPVQGSGYLALSVPAGPHLVELRLEHTRVRALAEWISLISMLGVVVIIILNWRRVPWRGVGIGMAIVALPVAALLVAPEAVYQTDTDLTMDFDRMPYLHHNPGGIDFGEGVILGGYTLSSEEVKPGDTLKTQMNWAHVAEGYSASLRLVSPDAVRGVVQPLAETSCALSDPACKEMVLQVPKYTPRGIYLLQLRVTGPGGEVRALAADGKRMGVLYLRPVRMTVGPELPAEESVLTDFGTAIRLHSAVLDEASPGRLEVHLTWSAKHRVAVNCGISLRVTNSREQRVAVVDTQPGYGFLPTSLWHPGELIADPYSLELPDDLQPGERYHLVVILYQVSSGEVLGQARLGDFALPLESQVEIQRAPRVFELPEMRNELNTTFGGQAKLAGYDLTQDDGIIRLTLYWKSLLDIRENYTVFVHLFDPTDQAIAVQSDEMPQGGTYPTSWWAASEVISDTIVLPLEGVKPGVYRLAIGMYDQSLDRLIATDAAEDRLPGDRVVLPDDVEVRK